MLEVHAVHAYLCISSHCSGVGFDGTARGPKGPNSMVMLNMTRNSSAVMEGAVRVDSSSNDVKHLTVDKELNNAATLLSKQSWNTILHRGNSLGMMAWEL